MNSLEKLKKFRQRIDELSGPIEENLSKICKLDRECMEKQKFVENLAIPVIQQWTKSRRDLRQKRFKAIKTALERMEQIANEKVKIANQSYETIDAYVVQLDKLYAKITHQKIKKLKATEKSDTKKHKRKSKVALAETETNLADTFDPTSYVDMPVDPNEPTYCFCNQVSFGRMICCDNKNCPLEWFHFDCVGLTGEPKGRWYCKPCAENLNKK
ncbi:Inhibitor of growth protein [Aphelenchoides bicaudatus]|nr:Inhibitor of growth protein [Aphelenchoides bicaudatus]